MCARLSSLAHTQTAGEYRHLHAPLSVRTSIAWASPISCYPHLVHTPLMLLRYSISNIRCGLAIQVADAHGHSVLSCTCSHHHLYTLVALRFNALLGVCIYHVTQYSCSIAGSVISGWQTYQHEPYHRLPRCLPGQPSPQSLVIVAASIPHSSPGRTNDVPNRRISQSY